MALGGLAVIGFTFISLVHAQTIPQVLSSYPQLSKFAAYVNSFPSISQQFAQADDFTLLAPTNDAISTWAAGNHSDGDIKAALSYHLLNGTYPVAAVTATPQFIRSSLTNNSYSMVTGGQRAEAVNDGHAVFRSALNATSTVVSADIIATGGLVHIIDTVLQIPIGSIETLAAQNLSYIIGFSSKDNFLSVENRPFINNLTDTWDLTYFVPNSAKALANFNVTGLNRSEINEWARYLAVDGLVYSSDFVNGTRLQTWTGEPMLITVLDSGEIYVNTARITGRDNFVENGVFHIIDDLISPWNISWPTFPQPASGAANENATTIAPASSSPPSTHPATSSSTPTEPSAPYSVPPTAGLSATALTGISVGIVGGALVIILVVTWLVYRRKQSHCKSKIKPEDRMWTPAELSNNVLAQIPQLKTKESPVELSAGYDYHV